ncbi:hypothetical protein CN263_09110 [Bacillus cereus]|uniref:Uncharacterized protein n=1 Tax=Bacillus cereus TaxID=1396 RepID=A0A9X6VM77_BACCE|nr:hypothetical protein CN284_00225 [Bacillus cereus]PFD22662.1 hypothetical protein CN263_09110 [Bacillus cereus]
MFKEIFIPTSINELTFKIIGVILSSLIGIANLKKLISLISLIWEVGLFLFDMVIFQGDKE